MAPNRKPKTSEAGIRITVDGDHHDIVLSELTAAESKLFRHATGYTIASVFNDPTSMDIDALAGLVWIVRRRTNPSLTYEQVADAWTYATPVDFEEINGAEEAPEVSGGS